MINIKNNAFLKGQRYRLFVLLSLFLMYHNHIRVSADQRFNRRSYNLYSAMRQTGIFPRGGGGTVDRYTDVLQIAQRKTKFPSATRRATRRDPSLKISMFSPSHPFVVSDDHDATRIPDDDDSFFEQDQDEDSDQDFIEEGAEDGREVRSALPYILTRKENGAQSKNSNEHAASSQPTSSDYPIIYRYFGRSRARSSRSDSIPFIILGPSADHWKIVGKILASRGFNVMVCERTKEQKEKSQLDLKGKWISALHWKQKDIVEGEALTNAVLDALKWQKAVLVGCDEEAVLAIDAALKLAPDRVAGVVLCGDLSDLDEHVKKNVRCTLSPDGGVEGDEDIRVDDFLKDFVDCPCSIIWDGDASSWSTSHSEQFGSSFSKGGDGASRSVIIGGGLAPHRRLPEQFAWTLTRFVENRVSSQIIANDISEQDPDEQIEDEMRRGFKSRVRASRKHSIVWKYILPPAVTEALDKIFAPGNMLVTGRVIATAIIYLSITRVSLFQYHNIGDLRAFIVDPSNLRKLVAVPGMFLRNRIVNRNGRARNSVTGNALATIFRDEIDEHEQLQTEVLSDSLSESIAIEEEEEEGKSMPEDEDEEEESKPEDEDEEEEESKPEDEDDSLPSNNVAPSIAPSMEEDEDDAEVDDYSSSFDQLADDLGKKHLQKFLFFDQIVS